MKNLNIIKYFTLSLIGICCLLSYAIIGICIFQMAFMHETIFLEQSFYIVVSVLFLTMLMFLKESLYCLKTFEK